MARVDVALLPDHVNRDRLDTHTVIVVDVLRASTTIVAAIESGAEGVVPVAEVDEAKSFALLHPDALLCGERGGVPPEGFVMGNSPLDYSSEKVGGRKVVLTTTNGTRALSMVADAKRVLVGSLTNRAAVCGIADQDDVLIVCAGTNGEVSLDDAFTAGMMVDWLIEHSGHAPTETAQILSGSASSLLATHKTIEQVLRNTDHGRRLIGLGMDRDIEHASGIDSSSVVPEHEIASNTIRAG
ncbi:MAG: 2-phosphosulfolactate phosphatase [Phycisphaerales bacterium]